MNIASKVFKAKQITIYKYKLVILMQSKHKNVMP